MSTEKQKQMRIMSSRHYLYPDVIYRINASFDRIWLAGDLGYLEINKSKEVAYKVPIFFSKHERSFHWITVGSSMWRGVDEKQSECREQLDQALKRIRRWNDDEDWKIGEEIYTGEERKGAWKKFLEDLPQGRFFQEARDRDWVDSESKLDLLTTDDSSQVEGLQRDLFALYSGFHHSARKNIEGLVYSFLSACGRKSCSSSGLDYITGTLCSHNGNTPPFKWFDLGESKIETNDCWKKHRYVDLYDPTKTMSKEPTENKKDKAIQQVLAEEAFLLPLLLNVKESEYPDGKTLGERVVGNRVAMLVPLYDTWVDGQGLGGIWGVIAIFFANEADLSVWKEKKYPILKRGFEEIADELAASARVIALEEHIKPPYDLVKHFLKVLPFVQDWEEAVVFDSDKNLPKYRYFREDGKDGFKSVWTHEDLDRITGPVEPLVGPQSCPIHEDEDKGDYYLWWTAGKDKSKDLWSPDFIRGLGDEEKEQFGKFTIRFKFPPACRIPQGEEQRKFLRDAYLRQQLDLMGMLVPKVRARRAALHSAATSIMSRNMSHNIGSHVLSAVVGAQYPDIISNIIKKEEKDKTVQDKKLLAYVEQRTVLLQYLQERMDFLAEAATARSYLEFPAFFYKEIVSQFEKQSLLLENITGIGVPAKVNKDRSNSDLAFSVPGGRLGFQAVYVILENFIRNTAKHAVTNVLDELKVKVSIQDLGIESGVPDDDAGYYRIRIWDHMQNGKEMKESIPLYEFLNKQIDNNFYQMVDQDGRLDPNNWGIREMLIAAAYLRKIPMEDLEGDVADHCRGEPRPLLHVLTVNNQGESVDDTESVNLCYEFHVRRPRIALLVGGYPDAEKERLRQQGVDIVSNLSEIQLGCIEHQYMVCCGGISLPDKASKAKWPVRILSGNSVGDSLNCAIKKNNGKEIWRILAQKWAETLARKHNVDNPVLYASLEENEWIKNAGILKTDKGKRKSAFWYDHHGEAVKSIDSEFYIGNDVDQLLFWEPYNQPDDQMVHFEHPVDEEAAASEFLAAGLSKIVVIDERVQEAVDHHSGWGNNGPKMEQMMQMRRIYVPSKQCCDLKKSLTLECFKEFIDTVISDKIDFIVVHQGILERLGESAIEMIQECAEFSEAELVICSGRGIPTGLIDGVSFVPLSSLLRWAVQKPSKFHLYQLLCASRSPKRCKVDLYCS